MRQHSANKTGRFLSTLVLMLPDGGERFRAAWPDWRPLSPVGLLRELERFLFALDLARTVFRADHASNWLVLRGRLGADKLRLLAEVRAAIADPTGAGLRAAWSRVL